MMRSMGYYPTDQEIENMKNEIKFSKYLETGEYVIDIEINTFLKLFVNHRPVYGIGKNQIVEALKVLTPSPEYTPGVLMSDEFKNILLKEGEKLTREELKEYEEILLGHGQGFPDQITADILCDDILGFEDLDGIERDDDNDQED